MENDIVTSARVLLLSSGKLTASELVWAFRLLAPISPDVYRPKLTRALLKLARQTAHLPEARLALLAEAVASAEAMDPADPIRRTPLLAALDAYQHHLDTLGRPAEAHAARTRMTAIDPTVVPTTG
ncbi:hypothetical protein GCM10010441_74600 [Kitasatospora paracochleata]|uniref:Transcriptional activator n=1 Tax=Kitasatospora paracochleata TaxID=58354 RepID=A0ABT1J2D6_9ACTN|nr:hypothetical protein [Kitasatospora paracochleata]MCP2311236.1 hypothetical protein [Kitasatospora paracochleata]